MHLRFTTAGESHGRTLAVTIEGVPAGLPLSAELLATDLARRQRGYGRGARQAIEHAEVLEYVARIEWRVRALNPGALRPDTCLVDKHHSRKHGPGAYYGQK